MEYLVTYGWAILAIVIIAAVLWYFGIFNPSKWTSNRGSGGFAAVTVIDYTVGAGNNVTLSLGNKVGHTITLTGCSGGNVSLTTTSPAMCTVSSTAAGNQLNIALAYYDPSSGLEHTDNGFVMYSG